MFRSTYGFARINITSISFSSVLVLLLVGCSGGGSSNGSNQTSNEPTGDHARLTWNAPTTTIGDECLANLSGYNIHYSRTSGQYDHVDSLSLTSGAFSCEQTNYSTNCSEEIHICSYTVTNLTEGTWYFAVQAYDSQGNVSGLSNEASKIINL